VKIMFAMASNFNINGNYNGPNAGERPAKHLKLSYRFYLAQFQTIQRKLNSMVIEQCEYKKLQKKHHELKVNYESKVEYLKQGRTIISDDEQNASLTISSMIPTLDKHFSEINAFIESMKKNKKSPDLASQSVSKQDPSLIPDELLSSMSVYFSQSEYSFLRQVNRRMKTAIDDTIITHPYILFRNLLLVSTMIPKEMNITYSLLNTTHKNLLNQKQKSSEKNIDPTEFEAELLNLTRSKLCCAIM
jgi:hypothetical protein